MEKKVAIFQTILHVNNNMLFGISRICVNVVHRMHVLICVLLNIASCCVLISCIDKNLEVANADQTLTFDATKVDTLLCNTIEKIDFLALESTENSDIYGVNKMVIKDDLVFVGDFHGGKIVVYDMNGKVKLVLNKKGEGPEEYLELKSFAVDKQNIYTLDNFRHSINSYDCRTGEFIRSQKLSFVAWDMEVVDDDHFIFACIPLQGGQGNLKQPLYKILITDKNLGISNKYLKYEQGDYEFIGKTSYFMPTKEGIVFSSMDSDEFIIFYGSDSLKRVSIDFADKIPAEYRKDRKKVLEGGYNFISQTPIVCKNYVAFDLSVGDNLISYIYDGNTERFLRNADVNSWNYLFQPIASYQNQLISYLDNGSLYEEVVESGFTKASFSIECHLYNEGAILIFYTMR